MQDRESMKSGWREGHSRSSIKLLRDGSGVTTVGSMVAALVLLLSSIVAYRTIVALLASLVFRIHIVALLLRG